MNICKSSPSCTNLGLLVARIPLGVFFALAGVGKVRGGVGNFVSHAATNIPSFLPQALGKAYLYAVPFAEIIVGAFILLGVFTRITGLIASLMLISFMIAVTGFKAPTSGSIHTNVVLLGMTLMLMFAGAGKYSVDGMLCSKPKTT